MVDISGTLAFVRLQTRVPRSQCNATRLGGEPALLYGQCLCRDPSPSSKE